MHYTALWTNVDSERLKTDQETLEVAEEPPSAKISDLKLLALRGRFSSTRIIANQWFEEHGRLVGVRTWCRRIRRFGLPGMEFNDLKRNESRFSLELLNGRTRVRERRGDRHDLQFVRKHYYHYCLSEISEVWSFSHWTNLEHNLSQTIEFAALSIYFSIL